MKRQADDASSGAGFAPGVYWQAIWQAQTPRELQGRVFSVRRLIAQFTRPIRAAAAGWLAGPFDPGYWLRHSAWYNSPIPTCCAWNDKAWLDQLAVAKD
jgi:hypothetical protein